MMTSTRVDKDRDEFPRAAICESAREFHICHKSIRLCVCTVRLSRMWWSFTRNCNKFCVMIIVRMFLFTIVTIFSISTTTSIVPRKPIFRRWKKTRKRSHSSGPRKSSTSFCSTPSWRIIVLGAEWTVVLFHQPICQKIAIF